MDEETSPACSPVWAHYVVVRWMANSSLRASRTPGSKWHSGVVFGRMGVVASLVQAADVLLLEDLWIYSARDLAESSHGSQISMEAHSGRLDRRLLRSS